MIYADRDAKNFTCPVASHANRTRVPCIGSACAWFVWHTGPGVGAEEYSFTTSEPVGGCGLLPTPSAQHWFIASGRVPKANTTLAGFGGEPFDAGQLNRGSPPRCAQSETTPAVEPEF